MCVCVCVCVRARACVCMHVACVYMSHGIMYMYMEKSMAEHKKKGRKGGERGGRRERREEGGREGRKEGEKGGRREGRKEGERGERGGRRVAHACGALSVHGLQYHFIQSQLQTSSVKHKEKRQNCWLYERTGEKIHVIAASTLSLSSSSPRPLFLLTHHPSHTPYTPVKHLSFIGVSGDETIHFHCLVLTNPVAASLSLDVILGIPVRVIDDHSVCGGEVDSQSPGTSAQQEDKPV